MKMEKLPRMKMVNTAVKFLQNPKVQNSNREDLIKFLEKKGLTKEEIQLAVDQVGETQSVEAYSKPLQALPVTEVSPWSRLKEHVVSFMIVGGVSYALYKLVKTYILPLFWEDPMEKRLRSMEERSERHLSVVEETMKQMKEMMEMMRDEIHQQNKKIDVFTKNRVDEVSLNEIKSGMTTLKGLLLNRRQFPATPSTQPIIPAWQRESPPVNHSTTSDHSSGDPSTTGDHSTRDQSNDHPGDPLSSPVSSTSTSPQQISPKVTSSWVTVDTSPTGSDDVTSCKMAAENDSAENLSNGHMIQETLTADLTTSEPVTLTFDGEQ